VNPLLNLNILARTNSPYLRSVKVEGEGKEEEVVVREEALARLAVGDLPRLTPSGRLP
jgi:hypothetical protein